MKKLNVFLIMLALLFTTANAQSPSSKAIPKLRDGLKFSKQITTEAIAYEQSNVVLPNKQSIKPDVPKNTDVVSIVDIGTSANAYGYGYGGGQKCLLSVNNDLNTVTNFHRMGGAFDPGGYSGDMGYDISTNGGITWTNMVECYVCTENAGGTYFTDAARYPNHGIYNPPGNTNPNNAFLSFFAPNLDGTNDTWGGYSYGRHKIGSAPNVDTTKHLLSSNITVGRMQYIPDAFTIVNANSEYWVGDFNQDWRSGALDYLDEIIISHGVWNSVQQDFVLNQFMIECLMQDPSMRPANIKIEFSPNGQTGYIAVLGDNGQVPISAGWSYFPILWRTTNAGASWTGPIEVAIAGTDGIEDVQNFLSDEEIAELYEAPVPDRDEIPFTTAFDFDLSVDAFGNPHIAVICGVTIDSYTIGSFISPSSGDMYTSAFLLSSLNQGIEGSWIGYELGRPVSFRGNFGDLTEDNRIQIARNHQGSKMFVSWLDTDPTVSDENNAPDIWARGVDIVAHKLTSNSGDYPDNVTFGSEATFSAYFFAMGNEVFTIGNNYNVPFTYQNMTPTDPAAPVQFKYIQDFMYNDADFTIPYGGVLPFAAPTNLQAEVSGNTVNLTWNAPPLEALLGYSVYRDGIKITPFKIPNTTYTNVNVPVGMHTYYVTAAYTGGTSGPSNPVNVNIQNTIPEYFTPIWESPYNPMTFYILEASIDEIPMQIGDEVGLFDIDPITGEEICVGAGLLVEELGGGVYLEMIASMDDGSNPAHANGFTPGNSIIYKLYNAVAGEITSVSVNYPYPGYDEVYTSQGSAFVELNGVTSVEQCINLTTGWNIMSFRAIPENLNMLNMVQPLIDDDILVKVLDEAGGSIFHLPFPPPNGQWSNTIGNMQATEGYYIKVDDNGALCLEGQPVETPIAIPLSMGWNIIGYPCEYAQDALAAVQALIDDDVLVKVIDEAGGTIFHLPFPPPNGQWSNTIGNFESGEGYYVKVSENTSLTIGCPADFVKTSMLEAAEIETSHFIKAYQNNPYMPMHIALMPGAFLNAGDEIGIFDGEICVGTTVVGGNDETPIITCSQNDPTSEIIDGFTAGNQMALRVWNKQNNETFEAELTCLEGTSTFAPLETLIAQVESLTVGVDAFSGQLSYAIVPNPFAQKTTLMLKLNASQEISICIRNLNGSMVHEIPGRTFGKGEHSIEIDLQNLDKGIYFMTIQSKSEAPSYMQKLIKM